MNEEGKIIADDRYLRRFVLLHIGFLFTYGSMWCGPEEQFSAIKTNAKNCITRIANYPLLKGEFEHIISKCNLSKDYPVKMLSIVFMPGDWKVKFKDEYNLDEDTPVTDTKGIELTEYQIPYRTYNHDEWYGVYDIVNQISESGKFEWPYGNVEVAEF